ncbi:hypothetical protein [Amedibacillus sp. YH-ame10]
MEKKYVDKNKKIKGIGEVAYSSKKKFKERYPMENVGYQVLGFIGDGVAEVIGQWEYNSETYAYYAFKKKLYFYEIIGYVEVEEDAYIAIIQRKVVKKLLPFLFLLAILISILWYMMMPKGPDLEGGMDKYEPSTSVKANTESTGILLPGYKDINMEANTDTAYVALYNPENNPCYFKFKITLQETGEVIYQSKMIPPGYAVKSVQFDRKFKTGIYPITIYIETNSLEDYTETMNGGELPTRIVAIEK